MAVGVEVVSAYSGPASVHSFNDVNKVSEIKTHKIEYSDSDRVLYDLYKQVRELRENKAVSEIEIDRIYTTLISDYPNDWLLLLELYELSIKNGLSNQKALLKELEKLKCNKSYTTLIEKGIALCSI